jgi:starch synthase (maltosyl-transferring)
MKEKIVIKNVYPEIEGGKYPVKTEIDRHMEITADVFSKEPVEVWVKYRKISNKTWKKVQMNPYQQITNGQKYKTYINFDSISIYEYTIEANTIDKKQSVTYSKILELFVEPRIARFGAWYEMFPRSQGKIPGKSGTFVDCEQRISEIKHMGFNVIYLPPIHPIGKTNRKGPNNSLYAGPNDPGCPWSIGDESGGHKAVHPELGTLEDFKHFLNECRKQGISVALDIAFTCSFDHPWIKEHPNWFFHNPDGTIKYAENPPKKYEDTVFLNFYPEDKEDMWTELKNVIIFWIKQGVKIFRIDNPHTKPDEFWSWLIKKIKKHYPDVIFLSEAFTNYERLELLAKLGFSQSYTYFTWRNNKNECLEYFTKLTQSYLKEFLRPNFFTNTPDILPKILQEGGRPAFKMRLVLASTVSCSYGIYSGFELCENKAIPGTESYLNSEKYEYKVWDWDRPGNIKEYIAKINKIRDENIALHYFDNIIFCNSTDDNVIAYMKISEDKTNCILVVVNLNPYNVQSSRITVPIEKIGINSGEKYVVRELITDKCYVWKDRENYVRLNPEIEPAYIFRIEKDLPVIEKKDAQSHIAEENSIYFFELKYRAERNSDVLARHELTRFYNEYVAPKVYTGPDYDIDYHTVIDRISKDQGYDSIIEAYIKTPGH